MTMPDERTRAVLNTQAFMRDLLDPKLTPKVPREIRQRAARCLRHYPFPHEVALVMRVLPSVFGPLDA